jgi:hypothetical protein
VDAMGVGGQLPNQLTDLLSGVRRGRGHPVQPPNDAGPLAKIQPGHRRFTPARLLARLRVLEVRPVRDVLGALRLCCKVPVNGGE